MKIFGYSLMTVLLFVIVFIVGAKWGSGIVSKIPVVNAL